MFTEYEYFMIVLLFVGAVVFSLRGKKGNAQSECLFSPDASHLMKAMCCIIIILHHWAFRVHSPWTENILSSIAGGYSLSVFFMLSTYGIAKSEMKHPLKIINYTKHRIWKILKPYLIVALLMLVTYWLIGATYPIGDLAQYRVSKFFVLIGQHQLEMSDYLKLIVNGKELSFHFWFVEVTIISYIYFFIAKSAFNVCKHRMMMLTTYTVLLLSTAIALMLMVKSFPYLTFVRNVPMMTLGLLLALFEKDIMLKRSRLVICYVVFNIMTAVYTFMLEHSFTYVIYTNYAILSVWIFSIVLHNFELKKSSPIMLLSALSYVIYLVHASVLTVEWWYIGFRSALVAVVCSIGLAYAYKCIDERKISRINIK